MSLLLPSLLLFAAIILAWLWLERIGDRRLFAPEPGRICVNVRPHSAMELLQTESNLQVLDVRSKNEFAGGALPRATNVAFNDDAFRARVGEMDRARPVLVYCAGGFRSRQAVGVLRALGFQSIFHLHRGYHSWKIAGLPVMETTCK